MLVLLADVATAVGESPQLRKLGEGDPELPVIRGGEAITELWGRGKA